MLTRATALGICEKSGQVDAEQTNRASSLNKRIIFNTKMRCIFLLLATSITAVADIVIDDSLDLAGFVDFSFTVPIRIDLRAIEGDTVTLSLESEAGSVYSIRHLSGLSSGSWSVDGTTALLNRTDIPEVHNNEYVFAATAAETQIDIRFLEGLPESAFFRGFLHIDPNK